MNVAISTQAIDGTILIYLHQYQIDAFGAEHIERVASIGGDDHIVSNGRS
jgi:hypothetical protein